LPCDLLHTSSRAPIRSSVEVLRSHHFLGYSFLSWKPRPLVRRALHVPKFLYLPVSGCLAVWLSGGLVGCLLLYYGLFTFHPLLFCCLWCNLHRHANGSGPRHSSRVGPEQHDGSPDKAVGAPLFFCAKTARRQVGGAEAPARFVLGETANHLTRQPCNPCSLHACVPVCLSACLSVRTLIERIALIGGTFPFATPFPVLLALVYPNAACALS